MLLSLCMPTNGISEWVFPALDSIYEQGVDESRFEVIVTNNGNNDSFHKEMECYAEKHNNLTYKKTNSYMFDNQLETLKLAKGDFLKFVNHRSIWIEGRLQYMIDFLEKYEDEKPVIYFSNGALNWGPVCKEFATFDEFIQNLGIYITWTSGVGIWKEDYDRIPQDVKYDPISPHSCILFSERKKEKYIINERYWMKEIDSDHSKKGKYDLYKAFALDEFIITLNLYRDGDITIDTLKSVKESYREFLIGIYLEFNLKKGPCSYIIDNFEKYASILFNEEDIISEANKRYLKEKRED